MIISLTGDDTIQINGRTLVDFGDMDTAVLDFPNDLVNIKTGKDGNSIYAFNNQGRQCTFVIRLLRGGADDMFMNNLLALFQNNPAAFALLTGEFIKNIGDGAGGIKQDIYTLSGGAFKRNVNAKENTEGDVEQAIAIYNLHFSNAPRSIG
jgi:hypothetical protein